MGVLRTWLWLSVLLTSLGALAETLSFRSSLNEFLRLRHIVLSKNDKLCQKFCETPNKHVSLMWRKENLWTDVCSDFTGFSELPRYWKVTLNYKYKLLFRWELPITVSIVTSV